MEFTKEELLKAKQVLESFQKQVTGYSFPEWIDLQLKPETKKIFLEVEYEDHTNSVIILNVINSFGGVNGFKVTELPEVFTREDMIDFALYHYNSKLCNMGTDFDNWLSEKKNNF